MFEQNRTEQYSTEQYSTVQYSSVQYSTVQYSTEQCVIVQYGTVRCTTVWISAVWYSAEQCGVVQYNAAQCGTVQDSMVHYCTIQEQDNHTVKIVHNNEKRGRIGQESNTVQHQSSEDGLKYNASPCSLVSCRITLCSALQYDI